MSELKALPRLRDGALHLADWLADEQPAGAGALNIFAGTVRNEHLGNAVSGMTYHAHRGLAEARLREIEAAAEARFKVHALVAHAVGKLEIGEISVIVVIRGGHRAEGFEACRWTIDTIKQAVPIWKEEHYLDGEVRFLEGVPIQPVESL